MNLLRQVFVLIALVSVSNFVLAANVTSTSMIEVKGLITYSNDDTGAPAYGGLVAVTFDSIPWNVSSVCGSGTVLIKVGDSNMLSTILAVYMSKTPIRLHVTDTNPGPQDGHCFLRAIGTI